MLKHNRWRNLKMPTKKPRKRNEDGQFVSDKKETVVEKKVEETTRSDVTTRHGSTIHYS